MIDLTGKTALVTGGSRGIGRAACEMLAQAGANVVLGYRTDKRAAQQVVEAIRLAGRHAISVAGDVRRRETFQELFDKGRDAFGRIDIVVGNAGIWRRAPIDEMSRQEWREMLEVNLDSMYLTCRFAAREMKPRQAGKIILVSSTAGQRGELYYSHYAATKGAILALTKSLAAELGPFQIHVNAVAPGWVDTEMCAQVFSDPEYRRRVENQIPLRRIASARDIAGAIVFLASSLSDHVQGEVLNVNGGSVLCG